ncbi:retrovirus-related pol polyprotein from transposon TNT 1-94 [Tanacetum coccineum]
MVVLTKRIDDPTKGKSKKGKNEKGKSEKGFIAESFDWDEEYVSLEDEGSTKIRAFMAIVDGEPSIGKADARSEFECETREPFPPLPKLIGDVPTGTSDSLISLSDLTLNIVDLTLNTSVPKKTKPTSVKVSQAYQLLLTLMEEVKGLKRQIEIPSGTSPSITQSKQVTVKKTLIKLKAQSSMNPSVKKAPKIPKPFKECKYCGFNDHHYDNCEYYSGCEIGGSIAHEPADFPKKHPNNRKPRIANNQSTKPTENGCSRHMTGIKQYLHRYSKESGPKVFFGDDSLGDTEGYGSVNYNGITFTRVAYVNGLKHNLISISQLCNANFKVLFTKTQGTIFNQNDEVVLIAPIIRDVYVIDMSSFNKESNTYFLAKASPSDSVSSEEPPELIVVDDLLALVELDQLESIDNLDPTKIQDNKWSREKNIELVNIIGEPLAGITTRSRVRDSKVALAHECLYVNFLSKMKPKKLIKALEEEGRIIAMQEELNQVERNKVWTLVPKPHGKTIIRTKWIWKNKMDENGVVIKNKARLVAQGYNQQERNDYEKTFAPISRLEAMRIFLAYAAYMGFMVYQMDMKSAFLNGKILEEVYVQQPPGFESSEFPNHVCKLDKALYGLKQAPRACASVKCSMLPPNNLGPDESGVSVNETLFRGMIGSLMYLTTSRPDIQFSTCLYARYQANPKESHLIAVKRIFRYLKGTLNLGLWYPKGSGFDLKAYSDSDLAGCNLDRKSTSGGCQILGGKLVCWSANKQSSMAMSSAEAEYVAAIGCCA